MTTFSAGAFIYSTLLTRFTVTGCYEVHPGVLRSIISSQQSTWVIMALEGGGAVVALKDGGSMVALGGGVEWRLKVAALLGGGSGKRTCDDASASASLKPRAY
jgi:hypothetical protein